MLVKKYCIFFSFREDVPLVLLNDNQIPSLEIGDKYNIYNFENIIMNIYFSSKPWCICDFFKLYQTTEELSIVDTAVLYYQEPNIGEWVRLDSLNEMALNEQIDKHTAQIIQEASRRA